MKKLLLVLAIFTLIGCDPYPAQSAQPESSQPSESTAANTEAAQVETEVDVEEDTDDNVIQIAPQTKEQKKEAKRVDYKAQENIRVSDKEVIVSKGRNDNVQTVKRVEDKDAVCWVVMNTHEWSGSISCIPRAQLAPSQSTEPAPVAQQ
ncbi:hypothetical protein FDG95_gp492 [Pectobacterium phage vB_PcaM_CBB]|uniref:Lipoprotein n=1 Tax=Pectobacterium phage vB_PcaM_CBB TaxID=2772511 RepID=A0A1L2CVI9_9CAUD|nr:hypothetical protein FDG95_gp492 [Pectobacterium phage vB_PcaM_CBB]AMM44050.1 hypothetical protein CBB_487 [Pectobacterium phage vB_PcaM_CBB]